MFRYSDKFEGTLNPAVIRSPPSRLSRRRSFVTSSGRTLASEFTIFGPTFTCFLGRRTGRIVGNTEVWPPGRVNAKSAPDRWTRATSDCLTTSALLLGRSVNAEWSTIGVGLRLMLHSQTKFTNTETLPGQGRSDQGLRNAAQ